MKKLHVIGLALVAVLAFAAFSAASASATQWLINGAPISGEPEGLIEAEALLRDTSFGHVVCSLDIDVLWLSITLLDVIAVLTLAGVQSGTPLSTSPILCKRVATCEEGTDIEAWPKNLPWKLTLELSGTKFINKLAEPEGSYEILCLIFGIASTDECTAPIGSSGEVVNVAGGVEAVGAITPNGNCSLGGANKGEEELLPGNLLTSPSGTVSVSE
jgi:hypothetical protein